MTELDLLWLSVLQDRYALFLAGPDACRAELAMVQAEAAAESDEKDVVIANLAFPHNSGPVMAYF